MSHKNQSFWLWFKMNEKYTILYRKYQQINPIFTQKKIQLRTYQMWK